MNEALTPKSTACTLRMSEGCLLWNMSHTIGPIMHVYRMLSIVFTIIAFILAIAMFWLISQELVSRWVAYLGFIGAAFVLGIISPSRRKIAMNALGNNVCPWCNSRGRLRESTYENPRWYCRDCESGWTARGKRVSADE